MIEGCFYSSSTLCGAACARAIASRAMAPIRRRFEDWRVLAISYGQHQTVIAICSIAAVIWWLS